MGGETTRNDEYEKPNRGRAYRMFSQVKGLGDFGLITRRSRVQIPPPLLRRPLGLPGVFAMRGRWDEAHV